MNKNLHAAAALFLGVFFATTLAVAGVIPVGPTRTYTTPSQAAAVSLDGDIIEIDAGIYLNDAAVWRRNNLTLRGVGGRAHMRMTQQIAHISGNDQANGKGIWVTQGSNITIENIEFSGASVADKNGAGIRAEGTNLNVRNSYFHDNENGILGGGGQVLIEYSEFAYNGGCVSGFGCSHNLYIQGASKLVFQYNYSHHAKIGHTLKSRAPENYILYNRITDETGTASYEIDLPNGGRSVIMGNLIQQSATTDNSAIISYGAEGLSNPLKDLYVVNNTVVNSRSAGGTFVRTVTGTTATIQNNLFVGNGTVLSGPGTLTSNLATNAAGLVNQAGYDYRLTSTASAVNLGTNAGTTSFGFSLAPTFEYVHPLSMQVRAISGALDVGAYEYVSGTASLPRMINLSTRGQVQTGDNVMIGGFIIGGSSSKTVLIRAVGPNLANFGVPGVLANPTLQLFSGQTVIASNDDWSSAANAAAIQATGLAPANPLESAILITLAPGAYTAIVSGVGGASGVGIVETFEIDNPGATLINISTRGRVEAGDNVMIGGFIIQGSTPQTVLIRAVGPNLANFGVPGVLANPTLQLFSGQTVIASNDDWQSNTNVTAIQATGLAPANALESALLITLAPGAYTAIVSGMGGGTGVGIIEVFAQ